MQKLSTIHAVFHNGIKWVSLDDKSILQNEPFLWGSRLVAPGHIIEHLGRKDRSSFKVTDAVLKYSGRIGNDLYFSLVNNDGQTSETDGWYVELSQVNKTTLLAQTAHNAFYDIKY